MYIERKALAQICCRDFLVSVTKSYSFMNILRSDSPVSCDIQLASIHSITIATQGLN